MAASAAGLIVEAGSEPPDRATASSPAMWVKNPSAICERWTACATAAAARRNLPVADLDPDLTSSWSVALDGQ